MPPECTPPRPVRPRAETKTLSSSMPPRATIARRMKRFSSGVVRAGGPELVTADDVLGLIDDPSRIALAAQPIVDLERGTVVGYELLARFSLPEGKVASPEGGFEGRELQAARERGRLELRAQAYPAPASSMAIMAPCRRRTSSARRTVCVSNLGWCSVSSKKSPLRSGCSDSVARTSGCSMCIGSMLIDTNVFSVFISAVGSELD